MACSYKHLPNDDKFACEEVMQLSFPELQIVQYKLVKHQLGELQERERLESFQRRIQECRCKLDELNKKLEKATEDRQVIVKEKEALEKKLFMHEAEREDYNKDMTAMGELPDDMHVKKQELQMKKQELDRKHTELQTEQKWILHKITKLDAEEAIITSCRNQLEEDLIGVKMEIRAPLTEKVDEKQVTMSEYTDYLSRVLQFNKDKHPLLDNIAQFIGQLVKVFLMTDFLSSAYVTKEIKQDDAEVTTVPVWDYKLQDEQTALFEQTCSESVLTKFELITVYKYDDEAAPKQEDTVTPVEQEDKDKLAAEEQQQGVKNESIKPVQTYITYHIQHKKTKTVNMYKQDIGRVQQLIDKI